jgi:uncharacterized membrane protein HdeD (DUF308 family)
MSSSLRTTRSQTSKSSIWLAVVLIAFGMLAIALPAFVSVGVVRVLAWLLLFDGVAQLVYAFRSEGVGHIIWKVVVALLYLAAGIYLLTHPLLAVVGLTLVLGIFFCVEGVTDILGYLFGPKTEGSRWILLHGGITLLLGLIIWRRWPYSSFWVVGTLVGVSMVVTGVTRLMMAMAERRAANA